MISIPGATLMVMMMAVMCSCLCLSFRLLLLSLHLVMRLKQLNQDGFTLLPVQEVLGRLRHGCVGLEVCFLEFNLLFYFLVFILAIKILLHHDVVELDLVGLSLPSAPAATQLAELLVLLAVAYLSDDTLPAGKRVAEREVLVAAVSHL